MFRDARRYREPTVMLFDEFDSISSYAGEGGDAASQAVNAVAGNTNLVAYAGTKGALVAMTRAFAVEFAPRIRVAAISPGAVLTHFTEQMIQSGQIDPPAMMERFLIRRFTTVEEIAELVAFLFGPAAGCITGSNWMFDGGYSAQ